MGAHILPHSLVRPNVGGASNRRVTNEGSPTTDGLSNTEGLAADAPDGLYNQRALAEESRKANTVFCFSVVPIAIRENSGFRRG